MNQSHSMGTNSIDMWLSVKVTNEMQLLMVSGGDDQGITANVVAIEVIS